MSGALDLMEAASPPMFGLGCVAFSRSLRLFSHASTLKFQLALPGLRLMDLALESSQLIDWEFRRIPEYPLFVPLTLRNSDANSTNGGRILTDAQWLLLKGLFVSLHAELDATRRYRRHKPLPDDRRLLRAILIKLAFGLRWRDLTTLGFNSRLCRTRYRQLYLSGRMFAIFTQLRRHLVAYGDTDLDELVKQGCFRWRYHRIGLSPGRTLTWQIFTALLLLQRAQRTQRTLASKSELLRRRRGAYVRLPGYRLPRFTATETAGISAPNLFAAPRPRRAPNLASVHIDELGSAPPKGKGEGDDLH